MTLLQISNYDRITGPIMLCPMVFGGITFYYSWKVVKERE